MDHLVHSAARLVSVTSNTVGMLPADRRRRLLTLAAREFADHGYERASLNRIIRACAMSKSSFYHYFGGKHALLDAVVTEIGISLVEALDVPGPEQLAASDFWSRIAGMVDQLVRLDGADRRFADLGRIFHLRDAPAGDDTALAQATRAIDGWLAAALEAGRGSGAVRTDLPVELQARLALAVLWAMDEWSTGRLTDADDAHRQYLAHAQLDAIRRLLAP